MTKKEKELVESLTKLNREVEGHVSGELHRKFNYLTCLVGILVVVVIGFGFYLCY